METASSPRICATFEDLPRALSCSQCSPPLFLPIPTTHSTDGLEESVRSVSASAQVAHSGSKSAAIANGRLRTLLFLRQRGDPCRRAQAGRRPLGQELAGPAQQECCGRGVGQQERPQARGTPGARQGVRISLREGGGLNTGFPPRPCPAIQGGQCRPTCYPPAPDTQRRCTGPRPTGHRQDPHHCQSAWQLDGRRKKCAGHQPYQQGAQGIAAPRIRAVARVVRAGAG